jgi:tRNA (guanine-N7-)-methyltransferase
LIPDGIIHLKTDNQRLFDFTLRTIADEVCELLQKTEDLHNARPMSDPARLLTDYEKKYLAEKRIIYYLSFRFRN